MCAEPERRPVPARKGCLPRTCSCLPLVAVFLLASAIIGYLQYRAVRSAIPARQPVVAAQPNPNLPSPERYLCREVRPALALRPVLTRWVLLLNRTHAADWLVAGNPERGYVWSSANFSADPQAFFPFIASTALFRNCPPGTFAELRAAMPPHLGVPDATPADTGTAPASPAGSVSVEPIEAETLAELRLHMLDLINRERSLEGLRPVSLAFNEGAQLHAEDMVEHRYGSHWNLRGETPYMRHTWAGGDDYSAENASYLGIADPRGGHVDVCAPSVSQQHLDVRMAGLMDSPGHRDNILRPLHREVNIGIARNCYGMAVVQVFEGEYVRFSHPPRV